MFGIFCLIFTVICHAVNADMRVECTYVFQESLPVGELFTCLDASFSADNVRQGGRIGDVVYANNVKVRDMDKFEYLLIEGSINLKFMPVGIMRKFAKLKGIAMVYCGLTQLEKTDLHQFTTHLEAIDFRWNFLQALAADVFEYNPNLKYVKLSENPLKTIPAEFFMNLRGLKHLGLIHLYDCECIDQGYSHAEHGDFWKFVWNSEYCRASSRRSHIPNNYYVDKAEKCQKC